MKTIFRIHSAVLGTILFITCSASFADTSLKFGGEHAKRIYKYLTGSAVQTEGAAGHQYRLGKTMSCRYTAADMDDSHGHPIPQEDPRRYSCSLKMDHDGFISVNHSF